MFCIFLLAGVLAGCQVLPEPLLRLEREAVIAGDREALFARQPPVRAPMDLYEALARGLKYNLDYRLGLMEQAIAHGQWDLSHFDLLPSITLNAGFSHRNNHQASSSYSITGAKPSAEVTTSADRDKYSADLTTVWNILDFGVSYVQAQQNADQLLIAEEIRRKAVHNLLADIRYAFWRAAGAEKLQGQIDPILVEAKKALENARQVEAERLKPQLEILRYQRGLLEIVGQLEELRHQMTLARTQFAALINLPPGTPFQLSIPGDDALDVLDIAMGLGEMEELALNNRPELGEQIYLARITRGETRKALLKLLPGLEFDYALNYDSTSFNLNETWGVAGSRVVWDLFQLLKGPKSVELAESGEELVRLQRLAMHMAVLSQVHLSYSDYRNARRKHDEARTLFNIDERIHGHIAIGVRQDSQNQLERIRAAATAINSRLQFYSSHADAQNAVGRIALSLGVDLALNASREDDIPTLARALREAIEAWNEGAALAPTDYRLGSEPPVEILWESPRVAEKDLNGLGDGGVDEASDDLPDLLDMEMKALGSQTDSKGAGKAAAPADLSRSSGVKPPSQKKTSQPGVAVGGSAQKSLPGVEKARERAKDPKPTWKTKKKADTRKLQQQTPEAYDPDAGDERYDPQADDEIYDPDAGDEKYDPDAMDEKYDPEADDEKYDPDAMDEKYDPQADDEKYDPQVRYRYYLSPRVVTATGKGKDSPQIVEVSHPVWSGKKNGSSSGGGKSGASGKKIDAKSAPKSGPYGVQLGAYLNWEYAESLRMDLREKGIEAIVLSLTDSLDRQWYLVRLGPLATLAEAKREQGDLVAQGVPAMLAYWNRFSVAALSNTAVPKNVGWQVIHSDIFPYLLPEEKLDNADGKTDPNGDQSPSRKKVRLFF
ncbi:MAG: TolC family protein [Magnetococcales bacterium]|nr:TolC family protein [Magnetococcales bacterium]